MMRFLPEKRARVCPTPVGSKKASCFSAVLPVRGWNQWVKWVAPRSIAHCLRAWATSLAMAGSNGAWSRMVCSNFSTVSLARYSRMTPSLKTSVP